MKDNKTLSGRGENRKQDSGQESGRPSFRWQWNGKLAIFALVFFPLTLSLGVWQLQRAEQKRTLAEHYEKRAKADPVELVELSAKQELQYHQVKVTSARPEPERYFLLEDRVRNGRVGYEVLWPVQLVSGQWVLVNRGWVAAGLYRGELPKIPEFTAKELGGYLYYSPDVPDEIRVERSETGWPLRLNWISLPRMEQEFGADLFPYVLRLETEAGWPTSELLAGWEISSVSPAKHTGYAVQWFLLALALVLLTLWANSNLGEMLCYRRLKKTDCSL